MTNKKLGLLLAPLIPLTAIGIVEVANQLVTMNKSEPAKVVRVVEPMRIEPHVAPTPPPPPAPAPEPLPEPIGPRTVTAD